MLMAHRMENNIALFNTGKIDAHTSYRVKTWTNSLDQFFGHGITEFVFVVLNSSGSKKLFSDVIGNCLGLMDSVNEVMQQQQRHHQQKMTIRRR